MIIGGPNFPTHTAVARPHSACGDRFEPQDTQGIEANLKLLRSLKDSGIGGVNQRLQAAEANLKLAQGPPRQFSPQTHAEVKAFLEKGGALPEDLTSEDRQRLELFKKLSDQGVQFVEPPLQLYSDDKDAMGFEQSHQIKTMPPECAFLKLIAYKFHVPENQVQFCTLREGMLATATLRADYLGSLSFFLDQAQAGQTFYKKGKEGYEKIEWASDFVFTYRDDPEAALVEARPGDLVQTARALETDGYLPFRDARRAEQARPGVAEGDTQVVVGGVLLRKRRSSAA